MEIRNFSLIYGDVLFMVIDLEQFYYWRSLLNVTINDKSTAIYI